MDFFKVTDRNHCHGVVHYIHFADVTFYKQHCGFNDSFLKSSLFSQLWILCMPSLASSDTVDLEKD